MGVGVGVGGFAFLLERKDQEEKSLNSNGPFWNTGCEFQLGQFKMKHTSFRMDYLHTSMALQYSTDLYCKPPLFVKISNKYLCGFSHAASQDWATFPMNICKTYLFPSFKMLFNHDAYKTTWKWFHSWYIKVVACHVDQCCLTVSQCCTLWSVYLIHQ